MEFHVCRRSIPVLTLCLALGFLASLAAAEERAGLIVEEIPVGGALAAAGVEPGDQLLSWSAPGLSGTLASLFDWWILAHGEAWKSAIQLTGKRDGKLVTYQVPRGDWAVQLRPVLPQGLADINWSETQPCSQWTDPATWTRWLDRLAPDRLDRPDLLAWFRLQQTRCALSETDPPIDRQQLIQLDGHLEVAAGLLPSQFQRIAFWFLVGEAYRDAGHRDSSLDSFRRSQDQATAEEPHLWWASATFAVAQELLKKRDFEGAQQQTEPALVAVRAMAPGSLLEARILRDSGYIQEHLGTLEESYRHIRAGLEMLEPLIVTASERARPWRNLGILRAKQGNLKDAQLHFEQALEWGHRIAEPNALTATIFNNLGMVAYSRGDLAKAQWLLKEAQRRKVAAAGDKLVSPSTLVNLGMIAVELEDYRSAGQYFREALTTQQQRDPESLGMATLLNNLGRLERLLGRLAEARRYHQQALAIQERISPSNLVISESLERLAQVDEAEGRWEAAATGYQRAQALRESLAPSTSRNAILLRRMAELAHKRGQVDSAQAFYHRAVTLVEERLEDLGGSHEQRQGFQSQLGPLFRDYIDLLVEIGQDATAFELQERSRARIFREMLAERDLDLGNSLPDELAQERQALAGRYDEIFITLASSAEPLDEAEARRLDQELAEVRWRREELLEKVRQQSPRLAALKYPRALSVAEIRATLDPGTLLLAYSVNQNSSLVFALSKEEGLEVHRLALGEAQLRQEVEGFLSLVQQSTGSASRRARLRATSLRVAGQRLFNVLLQPYEDRIGQAKRLLLLPDGPLYQLPFAALIREMRTASLETVGRRWQYLVEWKPVHFVLSASLYADLRSERAPPPEDWPLVAFGAHLSPDLELNPRDGETRVAETRVAETTDPEPPPTNRRGFDLPALPAARREVETIAALFPGGRAYLGAEVTEARIRELPPRVGLLHFATHVRLDEKHPLDSALVLATPEPSNDGQTNGLLQAWEIFEGVRVDTEMVVLSACESALGKEVQGEGLIGLTRAFHFAGARSVVASLWPVADTATAELMARFYRYLSLGRSKDEALRAAQLELLRGEIGDEAAAPIYWAAFQLSGDWGGNWNDDTDR